MKDWVIHFRVNACSTKLPRLGQSSKKKKWREKSKREDKRRLTSTGENSKPEHKTYEYSSPCWLMSKKVFFALFCRLFCDSIDDRRKRIPNERGGIGNHRSEKQQQSWRKHGSWNSTMHHIRHGVVSVLFPQIQKKKKKDILKCLRQRKVERGQSKSWSKWRVCWRWHDGVNWIRDVMKVEMNKEMKATSFLFAIIQSSVTILHKKTTNCCQHNWLRSNRKDQNEGWNRLTLTKVGGMKHRKRWITGFHVLCCKEKKERNGKEIVVLFRLS